jgi:Fic family protein
MDYPGNEPGEYRGNFTVTFGVPRRKGLCKTRAEIDLAMSNFVHWLTTKGEGILSGNTIVKAIMAHYYLTEIHPFGDGNGRTARALEALILYLNGVNSYCFWSLANFWSLSKEKYSIHLGDIRTTCNPWDFIIWGLRGYLDQITRIKGLVLRKVKQLMLMDYAKYLLANKKLENIKINQRIVNVLQLLIRLDRVPLDKFQNSPEVLALFSGKSLSTKSRDFNRMASLGLIKLVKENGKTYIEPNYHILESLNYNVN